MKLAAKLFILLGLMVAGLALATVLKARANETRAEVEYPPEGQFLTIDGLRIHAVVRGPGSGSGVDLVLIHGSSGSARDFTFSLMDKLATTYRVIAIDRPGLGYSDAMPDATIFRQAEVLQKAAAHLGADKPIVMGQSYGGSVALAWAVTKPDDLSALVALATPSLPWDTPLSRFYQITSHPIAGPIAVSLLAAWLSEERIEREVDSVFKPQNSPAGYADHFGPGLTLRRASLRANALQRAGLLDEIREMAKHYDQISVPTELLHGDVDTTVGLHIHSRPLSQQLDTANLTVLQGIGHMPHHTSEDDVIAAIHRAAARAKLH